MRQERELWKNRYLYLMAAPALIIYFLFSYAPMYGILIAFKKYNFRDGIFGSPWCGFDNFLFYFKTDDFYRTTFNTLWINFNNILWETVLAVLFAIFLNEIRSRFFKRTFQVLMFLPYFFSAIIIGKFVTLLFSIDYGLVNQVIKALGNQPVDWYLNPQYWVKILVGAHLWKHTGYSVIIYIATITGIDNDLFEASSIDGATRFQQIRRILIPHLVPVIITLTLLSIGKIFFGNFDLIYAVTSNNGALIPTTDVIETYIYRSVRSGMQDFGMLGAVGLYQSVVGFILVFGSNLAVKKYNPDNALF